MATQEQKLEIWRNIGKEIGYPPKDSEDYYRKTELYYRVLEDMNNPPQKEPVQVRREPEKDSRPRDGCCCDCHRKGERAPMAQPRRRVVRCDASDSEESEFGDVRLANRGRRVILTSDDESSDSDSDSDDEAC